MTKRIDTVSMITGMALVGVGIVGIAACLPDDAPAPAPVVESPATPVVESPTGIGPTITLPPCASEDSSDCYWDAATRGNGQGTSFVNLDGTTYYPEGN